MCQAGELKYSSDDESGLVRVLSFLKSHDTEYLSGQDLSDVLKISRVAVWKHIKKIRELGYGIESRQKLGYRLESGTDALLPWEVTSGLGTESVGRHAYYYETVDSTQDQAVRMAAGGARDGTVIIAGEQTGGRGRSGRRWASPKGGIWLSVILRPGFGVPAVTLFPMAAALALSNAIKKSVGVRTELKWPNDLTLGGKKVAGMLVDVSLESNRIESLVLGAGINFDIDARAVERMLSGTPNFYGAASLARKNRDAKPAALVRAFLVELERTCGRLDRGEAGGIVRDWTRSSSTVGRNVRVDTAGGRIAGRAVRVDEDGALVISKNNRTTRVIAGDVAHS